MNLLIIGGVAAGASTAARARRLSEEASITLLERGPDVSFANCGLPYYIGGEIKDRDRLAVQTPDSLARLLNLKVHTNTEAVAINRARKTVRTRDTQSGEETELPYDKLVLAPGAAPIRPPLPGIENERILTLRNLNDMDRIAKRAKDAKRCLVVGAGFIGLEMAEQLRHLGKEVQLVELAPQVLPPLDAEMAALIEAELTENGVEVLTGDAVEKFEDAAGKLRATLRSGRELECDLVVLSVGVRPESGLAKEAGLDLNDRGAVVTDEWMRTSDPDIYAAGDVVENTERVLGQPMSLPLGGPANRQGRVIASHIFAPGQARPYPGHVGTAIVRVFDLAAGMTGWSERRLRDQGIAFGTVTVTDQHHAGYYPGATPVTLKILWAKEDGRLLGAQAYGANGVDKRIDVLATAIIGRLTVEDLCHLELAYAPPFGSARDVVNTAGFAAQNIRDGLVRPVGDDGLDGRKLIDVRPAEMAGAKPLAGAVNIPFAQLRGRLKELDPAEPLATVCALGKTSYFAARVLQQHGYDVRSVTGGARLHPGLMKKETQPETAGHGSGDAGGNGMVVKSEAASAATAMEPVELDATGLSCPGPLMRVQQASRELADGQELVVTASDPGFTKDVQAFCNSAGFELLDVGKQSGVITARLRKPSGAEAAGTGDAPAATAAHKDTTLIVYSCEMDKALAAFVIANGGAAMGGKVTMFFTFWGLNVLRKEQGAPAPGKSFMDKMFGWMMPRGPGALPLSRMHMMGAGTSMMKWRMEQKQLPNLPGLMKDAQAAGVRLVACSMSMEAMGINLEELIDGVEVGGVADMLDASRTSSASLFI